MKYLKTIFSLSLLLPAMPLFAKGKEVSSVAHPVAIVLLSVMAILAIAILLLGKALLSAYSLQKEKDKLRKAAEKTLPILALLLLFIPGMASAQETATATAAAPAVAPEWITGLSNTTAAILFAIIFLELVIIAYLYAAFRSFVNLDKGLYNPLGEKKKFSWMEKLNRTRTVDAASEQEFNTGHDYDGIQELDNPTPPWWQWGFILSFVFAVIYLWVYFVAHSAPNQFQELDLANQKAEKEIKAYMASSANNIDENTVTVLTDNTDLTEGKKLFTANCAPCHGPDGGGIVGPNLTDNYWLHGGSIHDIFKTIKYGVPEKGMKSWKDDFTPKQIAQLASFVYSLKGTHPANPKEPQGDLYEEGKTDTK